MPANMKTGDKVRVRLTAMDYRGQTGVIIGESVSLLGQKLYEVRLTGNTYLARVSSSKVTTVFYPSELERTEE